MSVNQRGMRRPPFVVTLRGLSAAGGIPIGGVNVGDIIENVRLITTGASSAASFETTASRLTRRSPDATSTASSVATVAG